MTQIIESLNKIYQQKKHRIVFWQDQERAFESEIDKIQIEDVELIRLEQIGHFALKILIEITKPQQKFLIYSTSEPPNDKDDFLLDIRYYCYKFNVDRATILLNELGLTRLQLVKYLKSRQKFFTDKRLDSLKKIISPDDEEIDIDRKMLAVIVESGQDDFHSIVRAIFKSYAEEEFIDFETPSDIWQSIVEYGLHDAFWDLSKQTFIFTDADPTPEKLLIQLFVSDFIYHIHGQLPVSLTELRLPTAGESNAVICLAHWRDSSGQAKNYNKLAEYVADKLNIDEKINDLQLDDLKDSVTFPQIENQIWQKLFQHFNANKNNPDVKFYRTTADNRQQKHWINSQSISEKNRKSQRAAYELIAIAAELFNLAKQYSNLNDFNCDTATEMFNLYTNELYKYDQLYRRFFSNAGLVSVDFVYLDQVQTFCNEIDDVYCNKYISSLADKWNRFLEDGLLDNWQIDGVYNQYGFFDRYVGKETSEHRVFVIISDAFRYAAADELKNEINNTTNDSKQHFHAEIKPMLGVVPSYTALGMAALLPHRELSYKDNGDIYADDLSTAGIDNRNKILAKTNGIAIHAEELLSKNRNEGRKCIDSKIRVVYIYHNVIDSHGDNASTENETFKATDNTIEELIKLVHYISNNLAGDHIFITADHGYVYTTSAPSETSKSKNSPKLTSKIIKVKKRYFIGKKLTRNNNAWYGNTTNTARCQEMEFGIAKGYSRFNFSGSSRFFHGGAMLQEIVIPVVIIRRLRNKNNIDKVKIKDVKILILGDRFKITTARHRFQFVQAEPVNDRTKPVTVKIAIYDNNNQPVSSIETLIFNSTSENLDDRQQSVSLTLQSRPYDKKIKHYLKLHNTTTKVEILTQEVIIDRIMTDEF
ncbi:MAG: BREX-1 system phosphatase PglZ type A [Planctomycetaceae bacterium]|nr:BREX-1 system phosphatase PglZ type A [Planctomycetaceae bacterium]